MSKKRTFKEMAQVAKETVGSKKLKTSAATSKATKGQQDAEEEKVEQEATPINSMRNMPLVKLEEGLKHRVILWFRNDLRIHDNAVLNWAINQKVKEKEFLPLYCFDPRFFNKSEPKFKMTRKTGIIRTRFQLETVREFRKNLENLGS